MLLMSDGGGGAFIGVTVPNYTGWPQKLCIFQQTISLEPFETKMKRIPQKCS